LLPKTPKPRSKSKVFKMDDDYEDDMDDGWGAQMQKKETKVTLFNHSRSQLLLPLNLLLVVE